MVSSRTHLSKLRIPSSVSGGDAAQLFPRKQVLTWGLAVVLVVSNLVGVLPAQATGTCAPEVTGSLTYTAVQVDNDCVVSFTGGSGTWTPEYAGDIWLLMVAGGGAGGGASGQLSSGGGGGGAGELFESNVFQVQLLPYAISVGDGGAAVPQRTTGTNGGNSIFGENTVLGGGGGGSRGASAASGGSGGGNSTYQSGPGGVSNAVTGVGNEGASTTRDIEAGSGGGGGAGGPGFAPDLVSGRYVDQGGAGGPGLTSIISGALQTYSAGGSGASLQGKGTTVVANPGIGFGGNGVNGNVTSAQPVSAGSDGIIVVRYTLTYPSNTVIFDAQGGTSVDTQTLISGFKVLSEPATSLTDRLFLGWFDQPSGGSRVAFPFTPEADQTLFAQWAEYSTITFDSDGGSSVSSEDVVSGSALTTISEPVRANHQFLGWFDAPSGGSLVEFPWIPTVDITLHARWVETFDVTFDSQGGSSMVSIIAVSGSPLTTLSHPVRVGYSFLGWFDQSSGGTEVAMPFSPSADQVLFAQWIHGAIAGIPPEDLPTPAVLPINSGLSTRYEAALAGAAASSVVFIPAGALPTGASVKIYTMTNTDFLDTQISSNYSYLVTQIVSWTAADGTVPLASASISMTITDPQIKAGSRVFKVMNQVSTEIAVATEDGRVVIEFVEDPLLTVAATEPDAPFSVSVASTGASSAVVEWLAPLISGGGGAITYTATSGNGQSCTSSGLSCTVSGLESETSYSFTVTAANSIGVSPTSQASTEIQTGAAIPSVAAEPRPFTYAGPSVTSTPLRAASAGEIVQIIGEKLDLVTEVKISGVSLVLTKQEEGSIEFLLPSTTPIGIADLVIYSGLGKLVYVSFLEITQATEIEAARSDSVNQRLNAGAFNGFAAVYAKGFVGKTLSWQIGGRWFRQAITNDYQVFLRKAGQVGGSYAVRMFIDGEEMFAKTLATR